MPAGTAALAAGAASAAAVLVLAWAVAGAGGSRGGRGRVERERHARVAGSVFLAAVAVAVVLGAAASQLHARQASGLAALAIDQATVVVVGTVRTAPIATASRWRGAEPRFRTMLHIESVEVRGVRSRSAAQLAVLGGPGWDALPAGVSVRAAGRLLPSDATGREAAVLIAPGPPTVVSDASALLTATARVRGGLAALAAGLPGDAGALLPGMAVGDTSRLPVDLADAMRASGLTHLTAVSGAHFSLVGAAVLSAAAVIGLPRPARAGLTAAVLAGFVVLVEPSPSVLRAAVMGGVGLCALLLGRPARALPALAAAVVALLVVDPWLAREVGFVLSVLATAALVLLAGPLAARWTRTGRTTAAHAVAAPFAAQSACAPVVLLLTPSVSTYAVAANLLVAPVVAPITVAGLGAAVLAPAWTQGATILAQVAGAGCWWVGAVARTAEGLPGSRVAWVGGAPGALLLAAATAAALVLLLGSRDSEAALGSDLPGAAGGGGGDRGAGGPSGGLSVAGLWHASHASLDQSELPGRWTRGPGGDRLGRGRARARGARRRRRGAPRRARRGPARGPRAGA
ncbi:ComEC/Rec2 family competence protein [Cellulomonas chengniuliangii]|uniref:ComEC/Rec2 family competence protein n=1 Tax=Cellulomonas chengniuliangii TaxID=2968084 RepID=A0ABY5L0X3_9CELL|nr:ComEC/Rec2 family competence protein [Cellulomonas chengniuliangii]MCC2308010.1 ComEC/Rec2 family competence protein [Cellulomonas chengniuliangii]MCC2318232.1 ComEC/Rec2 family competence protein [Cellulomonas chengniuliangii]UUI76411.1 ComEC/Rec2 family competence protein [Cellulomonas chengniuliangii]